MSTINETFKNRFVRRALPKTSIPPIYPLLMQSAAGGVENEPEPASVHRDRRREQALIPGRDSISQIVRLAQKRIQSMNRLD